MPPSLPPCLRRMIFALATLIPGLMMVSAQQLVDPAGARDQWEVLENCRLVTNAFVDGDSFHLRHRNREYIVRLYFVDAPETDPDLHDRVVDQAAYFGIEPSNIPRAGRLATEFTRDTLTDREFTVVTRWQNAQGRSSMARFYGIVLVQGKNLANELVANGLARIHGLRANWPEGNRSTTIINRLKHLEIEARQAGRGVWNTEAFPRVGTADVESTLTAAKVEAEPVDDARLDLNTASYEALQELPGIGRVLAERIMAHRPFASVEELEEVKGIGPKTREKLEPLVRATKASPGRD